MEWYAFKGLYLAVDLTVLALTLALSFDKKVSFYKHWRDFLPVNLAVGSFFIIWDAIFTKAGIWAFNPDYLLGPELAGLPIEEWLFFFCIPYASVFTFYTLKAYVKQNPLRFADSTITVTAILICSALVVGQYGKWYIGITSFFTALWLIWAQKNYKRWMGDLWLAFAVLLVPFVLSNGVLTGLSFWEYPVLHNDTIITDQIVWYHPGHCTGWRIWSMPADDLVYGFLLFGMHIAGMEARKEKRQRQG